MTIAPEITLANGFPMIVGRLVDPSVRRSRHRVPKSHFREKVLALVWMVGSAAVLKTGVDLSEVFGVFRGLVGEVVVPGERG